MRRDLRLVYLLGRRWSVDRQLLLAFLSLVHPLDQNRFLARDHLLLLLLWWQWAHPRIDKCIAQNSFFGFDLGRYLDVGHPLTVCIAERALIKRE